MVTLGNTLNNTARDARWSRKKVDPNMPRQMRDGKWMYRGRVYPNYNSLPLEARPVYGPTPPPTQAARKRSRLTSQKVYLPTDHAPRFRGKGYGPNRTSPPMRGPSTGWGYVVEEGPGGEVHVDARPMSPIGGYSSLKSGLFAPKLENYPRFGIRGVNASALSERQKMNAYVRAIMRDYRMAEGEHAGKRVGEISDEKQAKIDSRLPPIDPTNKPRPPRTGVGSGLVTATSAAPRTRIQGNSKSGGRPSQSRPQYGLLSQDQLDEQTKAAMLPYRDQAGLPGQSIERTAAERARYRRSQSRKQAEAARAEPVVRIDSRGRRTVESLQDSQLNALIKEGEKARTDDPETSTPVSVVDLSTARNSLQGRDSGIRMTRLTSEERKAIVDDPSKREADLAKAMDQWASRSAENAMALMDSEKMAKLMKGERVRGIDPLPKVDAVLSAQKEELRQVIRDLQRSLSQQGRIRSLGDIPASDAIVGKSLSDAGFKGPNIGIRTPPTKEAIADAWRQQEDSSIENPANPEYLQAVRDRRLGMEASLKETQDIEARLPALRERLQEIIDEEVRQQKVHPSHLITRESGTRAEPNIPMDVGSVGPRYGYNVGTDVAQALEGQEVLAVAGKLLSDYGISEEDWPKVLAGIPVENNGIKTYKQMVSAIRSSVTKGVKNKTVQTRDVGDIPGLLIKSNRQKESRPDPYLEGGVVRGQHILGEKAERYPADDPRNTRDRAMAEVQATLDARKPIIDRPTANSAVGYLYDPVTSNVLRIVHTERASRAKAQEMTDEREARRAKANRLTRGWGTEGVEARGEIPTPIVDSMLDSEVTPTMPRGFAKLTRAGKRGRTKEQLTAREALIKRIKQGAEDNPMYKERRVSAVTEWINNYVKQAQAGNYNPADRPVIQELLTKYTNLTGLTRHNREQRQAIGWDFSQPHLQGLEYEGVVLGGTAW